MLYNEFIEGTGCKDNEKNYKVYKDLEVMYMNSDMSKAEIYEYGKKLVDNSKSEKELEVERKVKEEIEFHKGEIDGYKRYIESDTYYMNIYKNDGDKEMVAQYKRSIKHWKEEIRYHKAQIAACKWVLA